MTSATPFSCARPEVTLDHVGLYVHSLDDAVATYSRLGFQLTPLSQHSGTHAVTQQLVQSGLANRCAMLQHGYIELLGIVDPNLDLRSVPEGLARYAGMHILAFSTDAPEQTIDALTAHGFSATPGALERQVPTREGRELARFLQVRVPRVEMPEGLVLTLRHETPELLWQDTFLAHPNGALGLLETVMVVADLEAVTERYARYLGCTPCREPHQSRFQLQRGRLLIVDQSGALAIMPDMKIPTLPYMAGFTVEVADIDVAAALLRNNQVIFQRVGNDLVIEPAQSSGAAIRFKASKTLRESNS